MNFSFGTPKTTGGFTLGTPTNTAAAPGINYAAGDNKAVSTPQLGGVKTPTFELPLSTPGNTSGLQLGTPANTSTSFQLGTPVNPNTSFQLGTPASAAPNLSFGANTSAAPANLSFGATPIASSANFSLGSTSAPTLFSNLAKTSTAPLATPAGATSTPTFNLGSTLGATSTPTTSSGFPLGGTSSTGLTLGTPATTSTTFTLGKLGATPTTSASTGLSLTSTSAASTVLPATSSAGVGVGGAATPAGSFTFGQLEEALNKWTLELEDQGKMFINQALQLNAWDRLVIANGEKILTLNNGIEKVKQQQLQLDHELDFVLAQQRELEECIAPLEKELKDIPITDQDRNHTYQIAENMDTQLKQMSEDLKEIIEHLNESNKTEETNDPVAQIGRILNAHMNSLQWIDRNTGQISTYLDQITKMHDVHRRDNERSFHLTYE